MTVTIDTGRKTAFTLPDQNMMIRRSFGARVWQDRQQIIVRMSNGYRVPTRGKQELPSMTITVPEGYEPSIVPAGCERVPNGIKIPAMRWPARACRTIRFLRANVAPSPVAFAMPTNMKHVTGLGIEEAANRARVVDAAIASGWIGDEIQQPRPGPGWCPAGGHEGDTQGGGGIEPSPGTGLSWRLHAHLGDAWRQRARIDDLDPVTGEPMRASRTVDLQDASQNDGPDWPSEPWFDEWRPWQRVNGEHLIREVRHDVALAFIWRDPCAILNLRISAERAMDAITTEDMAKTIHEAELTALAPSMGRIHGWCAYTVGAASLANRTRSGNAIRMWLDRIRRLYVLSQVNGIFQHEGPEQPGRPGYAYWTPNPKGIVPPDERIAQSHEHGILMCGLHVAMTATARPHVSETEALSKAARVWLGTDAPAFRKWISTTRKSYGDPESLYLDWAASFCARWLRTNVGMVDLLRVRGTPTPHEWLDRWANNDDGLLHLRIDAVYEFGKMDGRW